MSYYRLEDDGFDHTTHRVVYVGGTSLSPDIPPKSCVVVDRRLVTPKRGDTVCVSVVTDDGSPRVALGYWVDGSRLDKPNAPSIILSPGWKLNGTVVKVVSSPPPPKADARDFFGKPIRSTSAHADRQHLHPEEWCNCRDRKQYVTEHSKAASFRFQHEMQTQFTVAEAAEILSKSEDEVLRRFRGREVVFHAEIAAALFELYGITTKNGNFFFVGEVQTCR